MSAARTLPVSFDSGTATLVGFSGGLDSTVLLHALAATPAIRLAGLRAIHVHHGLQPQADDWVAHCRKVCAELGIALAVHRAGVDLSNGDGPEAAARNARHAAFAQELQPGERLALAHHLDDQAETVLLRLLRASGSHGLAAMRAEREFAGGRLWRPLLHVPRAQLLAYARAHALLWVDDTSNTDERLDRNYLRHRVLPLLRARWPSASERLARSAALLAEEATALEQDASGRLAVARTADPQALRVSPLLAETAAARSRVLRLWIATLGYPPLPAMAVATLEHQLLPAAPDAQAECHWAGHVIRRWRDLLHAEPQSDGLALRWSCHWDGVDPLPLPTGDRLELQSASAGTLVGAAETGSAFRIAARQGGERIRLAGRKHSHSLKHVLQDLGVPPWLRRRLPLLFAADGELLAAADLAISARMHDWLGERGLQLRWRH
ncbi:tRNA lysidine(34) synthetase TilS [Arenimonas sp.]|uniref:tRNA lysidine(34) synthetase TilS n=1 Tax=Arenimonas sp. TaxID=1872635 RepID=UPI0039E5D303